MQFLTRAHKEKGICYQESVILFLCWRGVSWVPGKRVEPGEVCTIWEILQECELHIGTASLAKGVLLCPRLDWSLRRKRMLCCVGWDGESRTSIRKETGDGAAGAAKRRGKLPASALEPRGPGAGRAVLLYDSALHTERTTSSWDSLVLTGFWAKCMSSWHKRNKLCCSMLVAYVTPWISCSDMESISGINEMEVTGEGTRVPAFFLQR